MVQSSPVCWTFVVQSLSCVQLLVTPWIAAHQAPLSFTISWSLLRVMSIESVMLSNHLILCHPLLLLPSLFPSIRVLTLVWYICHNEWADTDINTFLLIKVHPLLLSFYLIYIYIFSVSGSHPGHQMIVIVSSDSFGCDSFSNSLFLITLMVLRSSH